MADSNSVSFGGTEELWASNKMNAYVRASNSLPPSESRHLVQLNFVSHAFLRQTVYFINCVDKKL